MKIRCLDEVVDTLKEAAPDMFKVFSPRRYLPPQGYCNPQYYAALAASINGTSRSSNQASEVNVQVVTYGLAEYAVPTYFMDANFGAAVMNTNPPEDMTIGEIKWPMPAMLFALPHNLSKSIFGVPVPFIAVSKMAKGKNPPPKAITQHFPNPKPISYSENHEGVAIHAMAILGADTANPQPVDYSLAAAMGKKISDVCHDDRFAFDYYADETNMAINQKFGTTEDFDRVIINKISTFAFSIVLAMAARTTMADDPSGVGQQERPQRVKRGVVVQEALWKPNMLGRHYKAVRAAEPGDGSHASPRMHWRRGHFRNQPYGPFPKDGMSDASYQRPKKLVWIEPVLVNAPEGEVK